MGLWEVKDGVVGGLSAIRNLSSEYAPRSQQGGLSPLLDIR